MGTCFSGFCAQLRTQTILLSGLLCAYQILSFVYWVHDKYMTVTALLHCIGAILIILGTLTLFCLYLPHMMHYASHTTKPRKTASIMILLGGILHFIGAILAISNVLYCNFALCEVHIFVFMILPFSITLLLFVDEFYHAFFYKLRLRITVHCFILFVSSVLFIPYYATLQKNEGPLTELTAIFYQVIWSLILLTTVTLIVCVGCKHSTAIATTAAVHNQTLPRVRTRNTTTIDTWASAPSSQQDRSLSFNSIERRNTASVRHRQAVFGVALNTACCGYDCACCAVSEYKRKLMITLSALLLMVTGTATLITIYWYPYGVDAYDLIVTYYVMVMLMTYFIGVDCLIYFKRLHYEPIGDGGDGGAARAGRFQADMDDSRHGDDDDHVYQTEHQFDVEDVNNAYDDDIDSGDDDDCEESHDHQQPRILLDADHDDDDYVEHDNYAVC